jgi:hypothetical protein
LQALNSLGGYHAAEKLLPERGFVTGHDFSRAGNDVKPVPALAAEDASDKNRPFSAACKSAHVNGI